MQRPDDSELQKVKLYYRIAAVFLILMGLLCLSMRAFAIKHNEYHFYLDFLVFTFIGLGLFLLKSASDATKVTYDDPELRDKIKESLSIAKEKGELPRNAPKEAKFLYKLERIQHYLIGAFIVYMIYIYLIKYGILR